MLMAMCIHGQKVRANIKEEYYYENLGFSQDRMWRKTRSKTSNPLCIGTDPNRNWDYHWCESEFVNY
jgi:hypothetical protein